jgi:glutathione S-transferase
MSTQTALSVPTKPTLYHIQYWSSSRPAAVLYELGVAGKPDSKIDIVPITAVQLKTDPVLVKMNPQRRLPFYRDPDADLSLSESGGLVQYFLEEYDKEHTLHPRVGDKTRAEYLALLHFGPATCYHIAVPILFKNVRPAGVPPTTTEVFEQKKKEWLDFVVPTFERALNKFGGPYLLGERFSAADIVCGYDVMTAAFSGVPELIDERPKLKAYSELISKREVYTKLYCPDSA